MTEIREPNYSIDLPGEWETTEGDEPSSFVYREAEGPASVRVLLLGVRPMFAIADQMRLLTDYMQHRSKYEAGQDASLAQSDPVARQRGGQLEGAWAGHNLETDRRTLHHVVLTGGLLADFTYEATGLSEPDFVERAYDVFATVVVSAE